MTTPVSRALINELLIQVMKIQKQYAHEQVGARNDRRAEIKKVVNRIASEVGKKNGN
jgi:hypothetical protein